MKVTNGEVRLMKEALEKLIALRIPASLAFKLAKLANKVNEHFNVMEIARVALVNQYGVKRADNTTNIEGAEPETKEKFWTEFVALLNEEAEIDSEPIELPEKLEVETSTLMPLVKFVTVK